MVGLEYYSRIANQEELNNLFVKYELDPAKNYILSYAKILVEFIDSKAKLEMVLEYVHREYNQNNFTAPEFVGLSKTLRCLIQQNSYQSLEQIENENSNRDKNQQDSQILILQLEQRIKDIQSAIESDQSNQIVIDSVMKVKQKLDELEAKKVDKKATYEQATQILEEIKKVEELVLKKTSSSIAFPKLKKEVFIGFGIGVGLMIVLVIFGMLIRMGG